MGVRYSAEQWAEWLDEQGRSGLTVFEYCDAIGVSTNSFYRWRARLAEVAEETVNATDDDDANGSREAFFVPLSVVGMPGVEIEFPCGALVRVPRDESLLRSVLMILVEADAVRSAAVYHNIREFTARVLVAASSWMPLLSVPEPILASCTHGSEYPHPKTVRSSTASSDPEDR